MLTGSHPWPDLALMPYPAYHIVKAGAEGPPRPKGSTVALDFLDRCLEWVPADRPAAADLLSHPFLSSQDGVAAAAAVKEEVRGAASEPHPTPDHAVPQAAAPVTPP